MEKVCLLVSFCDDSADSSAPFTPAGHYISSTGARLHLIYLVIENKRGRPPTQKKPSATAAESDYTTEVFQSVKKLQKLHLEARTSLAIFTKLFISIFIFPHGVPDVFTWWTIQTNETNEQTSETRRTKRAASPRGRELNPASQRNSGLCTTYYLHRRGSESGFFSLFILFISHLEPCF